MARDRIQQRNAERLDIGARLGAHVDPEIVSGHERGLASVLDREVSVRPGHDAGDGTGGRQHAHLLRLELLVPQRMARSAADPMEPQVAVVS